MSCIVYQTNKRSGITYVYESASYWDSKKSSPDQSADTSAGATADPAVDFLPGIL